MELLEHHCRVQNEVAHIDEADATDETQGDGPGQPVPENILINTFSFNSS